MTTWHRAKELFQAMIELPPPQRDAYLDEHCSTTDVRNEVLRLFEFHEPDSSFLITPLGSEHAAGEIRTRERNHLAGQVVGGFRLIRQIGVGGIGLVYEAEQDHPQRKVAIKLLRPHQLLSVDVLKRFEQEAEILGRLEHPGIARVYAAGSHDFGDGRQPWFAMELVKGVPLKKYRVHELNSRQKIELLLEICEAVEHAHARGVIHRDLKPSNIMVVEDTDSQSPGQGPTPRIVDFGVARVVERESAMTRCTVAGEVLGTLDYMSPEQVSSDPEFIDPRCDVYALGIIGFELLSGKLPRKRTSSSLLGALKDIESGEVYQLKEIASELSGDLTTIFNKALQPDPDQRYRSVQRFANDLNRYLEKRPIRARRPSIWYHSQRFAVRNWPLVATTVAMMLALIGGIVAYANQAQQARAAAAQSKYEADKAIAVNSFMTNDFMMKLLAQSSANEAPPNATSTRQSAVKLVSHSASKISGMFGNRPSIEAAVRNEVGTLYYNLGVFEEAAVEYEQALQLWRISVGDDHPDTLKAVNNLGQTSLNLGNAERAERLYRRALSGRIEALGEDDPQTLVTMNNLAELLRRHDQLDEAGRLFEKALELERNTLGLEDKTTLTTMANYGGLLIQQGKLRPALGLHRQVYESACRTLGDDHLMSLQSAFRYAQTLHRAEVDREALKVLLPAQESTEELLGSIHGLNITMRRLLSRIYRDLGDFDSAENQLWAAANALETDEGNHEFILQRIRLDRRRLESRRDHRRNAQ